MTKTFFSKISGHILILFMCNTSVYAVEKNTPDDEIREVPPCAEPLFISLGPECHLSYCLARFEYRKAAFPFDWLLTLDHDRMIELLNDDFKYFFDDSYYSRHTNDAIIHTYYHIEFRHDGDELKAKYERRINRFRKLDDYSGKIFFIRKAGFDPENVTLYWPNKDLLHIRFDCALEFKHALKKRFPKADFTLVIVNYSEDKRTVEIRDDIIIFTFPHASDYCLEFRNVFDALIKYAENPSLYPNGAEIPF